MKGSKICNQKCCGCSACSVICPKKAITMTENSKGFLEPFVDENLCINCNLCSRTCNKEVPKKQNQKTVIMKLRNSFQLLNSQSGGAFWAISEAILKQGGCIYGVGMDDSFEAVYIKATNSFERDLMRHSKYMQARVENIFADVKNTLANQKVLFVGTPCQVGGLLKYLDSTKTDITNLFTVDLICHGTPSVLLWRSVLKHTERNIGNIRHAICRDKLRAGWGNSYSTFYGDKKYSDNIFCRIFFTDLCLRDSCYSCQYTTKDRVGDITIGDAWGVKEKNPDFYDSRGVSLMLINSNKGEQLFDIFKEFIEYKEVPQNDYVQKNMLQPSRPHRNPEEFWHDFHHKNFNYIIKKYGKNNIFLNYKYILKKGVNMLCKRK